jgi:hypothetical protein
MSRTVAYFPDEKESSVVLFLLVISVHNLNLSPQTLTCSRNNKYNDDAIIHNCYRDLDGYSQLRNGL